MGDTGPCGRCSEIYYVRGGSGHDPEIEIWNNVFMEFERSADGTLTPLPAPCIDTGMGLERVTAVLQGKQSNYDTDLFTPLLARIGEMRGLKYGDDETRDISMRVVADHTRAMTFLIADGVVPSNEWRGYVLRKIMRRAMRHGKHLGISGAVPPLARGHDGRRVRPCLPGADGQPRVDCPRHPRRGRALRRRAHRRAAKARGRARSGGRGRRRGAGRRRRSGSTTPSGFRATSSRT